MSSCIHHSGLQHPQHPYFFQPSLWGFSLSCFLTVEETTLTSSIHFLKVFVVNLDQVLRKLSARGTLWPAPHAAPDASCCSQTTSCLQHPEACLPLICSFPSLLINDPWVCLGHKQMRKNLTLKQEKTPETKKPDETTQMILPSWTSDQTLNLRRSVVSFLTSASDTVQLQLKCCRWPLTGFLSCFCLTHRQERRGGKNHKRQKERKEGKKERRADEKDPYWFWGKQEKRQYF